MAPTTVVLLHGWPGSPNDFRDVRRELGEEFDVIAPDLRVPVADATAAAWANRVLEDLTAPSVVLAGYDIGSRVGQLVAQLAPERVAGLVATPYFPALANRTVDPAMASHYWYQHFHRLGLADELLDGNRDALGAYLTHIWRTWSADGRDPDPQLIEEYARPGAFTASVAWYRENTGYSSAGEPVACPTTVLWGDRDPLFPVAWAEDVPASFSNARKVILDGVGHFIPVEAPTAFAAAVRRYACEQPD